MIGIIHEEVPVLVTPTEPSIITNNQLAITVSTGVIQALHAFKTPATQEFITVTTPYNMGANRTPQIFIRTGVDDYSPAVSGSVTRAISSCASPTPPYVCIWNESVGNIGKTTTPKFTETSELNAYLAAY